MTLTKAVREALRAEARAESWRRGNLRWKMHPVQQRMYDAFRSTPAARYTFECARRLGKSWLLVIVALETAIQHPGCTVIYGAPTIKALVRFVIPALEQISADCPDDVRGRYVASRGEWQLPNGARIILFGADDKPTADRGRGDNAMLCIADEAGFFPVEMLTYILQSVFKPSMQLSKGQGRTLVASTPSPIPEHDFTVICERAEAEGNYARYTIHDNPMLSEAEIAAFIAGDAAEEGMSIEQYQETDTFRREYLAQRVVDKLLVVLPEWNRVRGACIAELPAPEYFDAMTVLDFGGADPHAALFAYWDFQRAQLVVVDELLLRRGENTAELVAAIQAKERALWGVAKYDGSLRVGREDPLLVGGGLPQWLQSILVKDAPTQPYSRWCDNDIQLAKDMHSIYGLAVIPTRKDDLELQVHNLRVLVGAGKLVLHPRCVQTDRHFRGTTWENHRRHGFTRKAGEHGDLLAAGIYLARNVDRQRNPIPTHLRTRATVSLAASARAMEGAKAKTPGIYQHTRLGQRLAGKR